MAALAELLQAAGCRVQGSDLDPAPRAQARMQSRGIPLLTGDAAEHLPPYCDRVIYSAAVPSGSPERQAATARGIPQQSYPQFLGELSRRISTTCIAGTHGKSTTTAALASILRDLGASIQVICGAEPVERLSTLPVAPTQQLVLESCEFRRHFLHFTPHTLVLTGIEWDHVDCFRSLAEVVDAFSALLRRVPEDGLVLYRGDCAATQRAVDASRILGRCTGPRVVSFGLTGPVDWRLVRRRTPWGSAVDLYGTADDPLPLDVRLPGLHNALNVSAAVLAALEAGRNWCGAAAAAARFRGVRRRLELLGEWRGMTLIDDYAHHPTAVQAALQTLREEFSARPLRVVFQPHQAQRAMTFCAPFAAALRTADFVHILPAYTARESADVSAAAASQQLIAAITGAGGHAGGLPSLDHVWETLETEGRPGDVVVLMGAGSIERIADECSVRLRRHHAG